jgi:phytoene dehydrogenase-like protein
MRVKHIGDYDGIILGAGHNALILATYLGQSGVRVLAVDRAAVAGGGLATLEHPRHSGFLHNTHAFFQRAITAMPWYADLDLERHGARYIEPELNVALLTRNGRALEWWTDIERTIGSVAQFSRRDGDTLRRWHDDRAARLRTGKRDRQEGPSRLPVPRLRCQFRSREARRETHHGEAIVTRTIFAATNAFVTTLCGKTAMS